MTKPKTEADCGIGPHWKVRVVYPYHTIHLVTRSEPVRSIVNDGNPARHDLDVIEGTPCGDTVGHLDWSHVVAVTWRKA